MRTVLLATSLALGMAVPVLLGMACSAQLPGPRVCDARSGL